MVTWKIDSLECAPSLDGMTNVVRTAHWRAYATDGELRTDSYGSVALASPDPSAFIAYDALDEATVIAWVHAALEAQGSAVADMEAGLEASLKGLRNPPIVKPQLPWEANA